MPDEKTPDELLSQFKAAISGMELDELRDITARLAALGRDAVLPPQHPPRPNLRRPRRGSRATYRIRVDLDHSWPPIWRQLDVRSDLTLDVVHQVLQAAFDWTNSHLHRFALGGDPFEEVAELFLCPFDVEEGDDGTPASAVRLDETLQEPGDDLYYVYDYGDHWGLTLRLETVRDAGPDAPLAVCIDGRRAAPPDDCGGRRTADELVEVLEDPALFDPANVNTSLRDPFFALLESGAHPRYVEMVQQLTYTDGCEDFAEQLLSIGAAVPELSAEEKHTELRAFWWFLDRASGHGLELTSAGYLKPNVVEEVATVVPSMAGWIGKNNREANAVPLLSFRKHLQAIGLLRKHTGRLLLTRVGASMRKDPEKLWDYLARCLVPPERSFEQDATLLTLGDTATAGEGRHSDRMVATALTHLGWRAADSSDVDPSAVYSLEPDMFDILWNVGDHPPSFGDRAQMSPAAAALARSALTRGTHVDPR